MNDSSQNSNSCKKAEILKMTVKIVERYDVFNFSLANKVAMTLYDKGIGIDKFQEKYYKGKFHLDEIVLYLLKKQIREEKTIDYKDYISNNKEKQSNLASNNKHSNPTEKTTKIIPYKYDGRRKKDLSNEWQYHYNKNIK